MSCAVINSLERAASSIRANESVVLKYESALAEWRESGIADPPQCRLIALGARGLCRHSVGAQWRSDGTTGALWSAAFAELVRHLREDCDRFHEYDVLGWNPPIFQWFGTTPVQWLRRLEASPDWFYYSRAALSLSFFGSRVPSVEVDGVRLKWERVQHVHHLMVLKTASGMHPHDFQQIVEFGAGTGDNVPTCRELGFAGSHMIFDVPPMLLLQQYVLRYSGWPAYLGAHVQGSHSTTLFSNATLLVKRLNLSLASRSLLIATFSLSEAPVRSRRWVSSVLQHFGVVLIAFRPYWDGVDNVYYLRHLVLQRLRTHSACAWRMPDRHGLDPGSKPSYYFVAVRHDVGTVQCSWKVGCGPLSRVPGLGSCGGQFD
eukprot:CAMPEP_0117469308 /NCGR_PEP_ID=MMETSP0784-20121206/6622_1 /TAXON_ID=39447 /ORGANISM="" /LENGTH=373 /DNA_ID=CAMNT_0005263339 /DNA_START=59 /DNA_END=1177 /DNA_ORIENTATION=+